MTANLGRTSDGRAMYAGRRPGWHREGQLFTEQEARDWRIVAQRAGLTYDVGLQPVKIDVPRRGAVEVPKYRATVRKDTWQVLGMVTATYSVAVQPRDILRLPSKWWEADGHRPGWVTAGGLGKGERVWGLMQLGDDYRLAGKDRLKRYLFVSNGYDGQTALDLRDCTTNVECANTWGAAMSERAGQLRAKIRHTSGMEQKLTDFAKAAGLMTKEQDEAYKRLEILAQATARQGDIEQLFELVVPTPDEQESEEKRRVAQQQRLALWRVFQTSKTVDRSTLYGGVQAASEYIEHFEQRRGQNPESSNSDWHQRRMVYITEGEGQDRLSAVFKKAYAMAGITGK